MLHIDKSAVAREIADNITGEFDAIADYQDLMGTFQSIGDTEGVAAVAEIISDELNHAERLKMIMKKYDGGIEPAEDGFEEDNELITY